MERTRDIRHECKRLRDKGRVGELACLGAAGESPCSISLFPSDRRLEKEARQLNSLEEHVLCELVGCT